MPRCPTRSRWEPSLCWSSGPWPAASAAPRCCARLVAPPVWRGQVRYAVPSLARGKLLCLRAISLQEAHVKYLLLIYFDESWDKLSLTARQQIYEEQLQLSQQLTASGQY